MIASQRFSKAGNPGTLADQGQNGSDGRRQDAGETPHLLCYDDQQRPHLFDHIGDRMGFQANDDVILLAELGEVVGAGNMHDAFFADISSFNPFARMAARCAPRATRLTSAPACAS
jgi:hypothetical protein